MLSAAGLRRTVHQLTGPAHTRRMGSISPTWGGDAERTIAVLGPTLGDPVVFRRGGTLHLGAVTRVGRTVLDVDAVLHGHRFTFRVRGDMVQPAPACGHVPTLPGCGGCDPAAVDLVHDDTDRVWRKAG